MTPMKVKKQNVQEMCNKTNAYIWRLNFFYKHLSFEIKSTIQQKIKLMYKAW